MRSLQTSIATLHSARRGCSGHLEGVNESLNAAVEGAKRVLQEIVEERSLCEENLRERREEVHCASQHRIEVRQKHKIL